jgi:hypothetical protein
LRGVIAVARINVGARCLLASDVEIVAQQSCSVRPVGQLRATVSRRRW